MSGSLSEVVGFGPIRAKATIAAAKKLTVETTKSAKTAEKKAKKQSQSQSPKRNRSKRNRRKRRRSSSADLGCSYVAVEKASRPEKTLNSRVVVPRNAV